jgi:hypothetical protein
VIIPRRYGPTQISAIWNLEQAQASGEQVMNDAVTEHRVTIANDPVTINL